MLQVDLSKLSGPDLRRLLDTTRARGQAAESYRILQEMAARRDRGAKSRKRDGAEPRLLEVDLGDPLERADDELPDIVVIEPPAKKVVARRPQTAKAPPTKPLRRRKDVAEPRVLNVELSDPPEPTAPMEPLPPLRAEPEPALAFGAEPDDGLRFPHQAVAAPAERPRVRRPALVFVTGVTIGVGLSWAAGTMLREVSARPVAAQMASVAPAPAPVMPAPVSPPAGLQDAVAQTAPEASAPLAEAAPSDSVPPAPDTVEVAQAAETAMPSSAESDAVADEGASADVAHVAAAGPKGCAGKATPADRAICADPTLQRLQRELRQAYADALGAHEDRALLRERQLAWRDARSDIGDPDRLARLYEQRIRKLNAATAAARRARES